MSDENYDQRPFGSVEFAENPENRCPVILLLDNSGSMGGRPIQELNAGLQVFRDELFADSLAAKRVDVAIVTFGPVKVEMDFVGVQHFHAPTLSVVGDTPMGAAIEQSLSLLRSRKDAYKSNGIGYYRPWVFLITDGGPTDSVSRASQLIREGEDAKAFIFFCGGGERGQLRGLEADQRARATATGRPSLPGSVQVAIRLPVGGLEVSHR